MELNLASCRNSKSSSDEDISSNLFFGLAAFWISSALMVFRITWANIPNRQITIPHKLMKVISLPLIITAKVKMVTSLKTPIMAKVSEEVTILTLAVIINGNEITFINLCGMVICLLGIFAHVIRKTIKADEIQNAANPKKRFEEMSSSEDDLEFRHEARFNSMRRPIMTKEGLPLLDNDSEDSDEIDMKTAATKSSRHRLRSTNSNSDDNYLKET
jgi:hypothetical protein